MLRMLRMHITLLGLMFKLLNLNLMKQTTSLYKPMLQSSMLIMQLDLPPKPMMMLKLTLMLLMLPLVLLNTHLKMLMLQLLL